MLRYRRKRARRERAERGAAILAVSRQAPLTGAYDHVRVDCSLPWSLSVIISIHTCDTSTRSKSVQLRHRAAPGVVWVAYRSFDRDTNEKLTPLNQAQNGRDAHLDLLCRYQSLCRCGAHALLNPCECKQAERQFDRAGLFLCGYGAFSRDSGNTGANAAQLQVDGISL